ncbi:StAR-related lipid transfer protein 9 START domain-containing protein 9 [Collichthys lucidus]|uniref:StAR-related lipid transfer protein 9 START domain-containing protein 9 n=1 Tax=Collichthys lucidus TaxID=240159 RepID=A0A4U5VFQ6_COLLU|nr:StAR-related lipid transfer protein 9 START domain-containing protein 9 [Collichthys lucidus]
MANVKVAIRVRPPNARESADGGRLAVQVEDKFVKIRNAKLDGRTDGHVDSREKLLEFVSTIATGRRTPQLPTMPRRRSRRKLPAIPAGAANAKFPSVIRITRAQLQQLTAQRPSGLSSRQAQTVPHSASCWRGVVKLKLRLSRSRSTQWTSAPPRTTCPPIQGHPQTPWLRRWSMETATPKLKAPCQAACLPRVLHARLLRARLPPRSPRSPMFTNGHLSPLANGQSNGAFPKLKDPENGNSCATEPQLRGDAIREVNQAPDQTQVTSSPAVPRKDPSRRQSRIPILEPSILLELPPPGSAKEKLLQKKANHHGPVPSPTASPSLSDRRGPMLASLAKDPLSSASDRSQDEDSLMGSRSDRQGDDAPSPPPPPALCPARAESLAPFIQPLLLSSWLHNSCHARRLESRLAAPQLRRYRIRAGSTSDSDLLTCLAQLMHGSRGSPLHHRSSAQHGGSRMGICSLTSSPHHHRSSSASPRSSSSLQRSVSSSPSRHEHRGGGGGGCLGRSRSPPSFSGSPPRAASTRTTRRHAAVARPAGRAPPVQGKSL